MDITQLKEQKERHAEGGEHQGGVSTTLTLKIHTTLDFDLRKFSVALHAPLAKNPVHATE